MSSAYAVLGLSGGESREEVDEAYKQLKEALSAETMKTDGRRQEQAGKCLLAIEAAYAALTNPDTTMSEVKAPPEVTPDLRATHPRLGQLCAASGMITMDQLREAVEAQANLNLQLGEILQQKQFISQSQLDGLLLGQQMIDMPSAVVDAEALRLVSLGLITEDVGLLVQMEKRSLGASIKELVIRHGWVDAAVLDAVLD